MKKNLFGWLAMATMLVGTGCSSDEVVNDYSPENAIQFGTYVGRDAQGRVVATTTDNISSFGVFAIYHDDDATTPVTSPNFMNNQVVHKSTSTSNSSPQAYGTGWTYSPIKYWPNEAGDLIDFYAYSPYELNKSWNNGMVNISIASDENNQIDYLVANAMVNQNKNNTNDQVTFTFNHALSRVGFKVEAVIDDVNSQQNGNFADSDNESEAIGDGTTISVQEVQLIGNFYESADLNLLNATWNYENATLYTTSPIAYTLQSEDFISENAANVEIGKKQLNNANSYLMLIPKNFKDNDKIQIFVKYTVETVDHNITGNVIVENKIYSGAFNFEFIQGKAYDFVLHLGLESVKLSANVINWETSPGNTLTDVVVNVPIND